MLPAWNVYRELGMVCEDCAANRAGDPMLQHAVDALAVEDVVALRELADGVRVEEFEPANRAPASKSQSRPDRKRGSFENQ